MKENDEMQRRRLLAWAGLAALAGTAKADDKPTPPPPPLERVPMDVPLGRTLDGNTLRLSDFEGKPVVLFFWASWCPHCRNELPQLERLQLAGTKERVRVVAVNVEDRDIFRKLHRGLSDKMQMLHLYDPEGVSAKAFAKADGVPYTVVVRGDGTIVKTMSGWCESGCLEDIITHVNGALAAGRAASAAGG